MREFPKETILAYRLRTRRGLWRTSTRALTRAATSCASAADRWAGRGAAPRSRTSSDRHDIESHSRARLVVPSTAVFGAAFSTLPELNDLLGFALRETDDAEPTRRFLAGELPEGSGRGRERVPRAGDHHRSPLVEPVETRTCSRSRASCHGHAAQRIPIVK
jgi:hypothetical protein